MYPTYKQLAIQLKSEMAFLWGLPCTSRKIVQLQGGLLEVSFSPDIMPLVVIQRRRGLDEELNRAIPNINGKCDLRRSCSQTRKKDENHCQCVAGTSMFRMFRENQSPSMWRGHLWTPWSTWITISIINCWRLRMHVFYTLSTWVVPGSSIQVAGTCGISICLNLCWGSWFPWSTLVLPVSNCTQGARQSSSSCRDPCL